MVLATSPDHELPNPARRVLGPAPGLRGPALVVVVMAGEDDLRARRLEGLPEGLHARVVAVAAEAKARMVPVGQGTFRRMGRQIVLQPGLLRRVSTTPARLGAVGVED